MAETPSRVLGGVSVRLRGFIRGGVDIGVILFWGAGVRVLAGLLSETVR